MQAKRLFSFFAGCFLVMGVHAVPDDGFVHRLTLTEGDKFEFETLQFVETKEIRYRVHSRNFLNVLSAVGDEYSLETVNRDLVFAIEGGRDTYLPSTTTTVRQRSDGKVLEIKNDLSADAGRFAKNPNNFRYPLTPVGVGGHWDNLVPADPALGTPETIIRYVVSGRKMWRGFDVLVVDFMNDSSIETPMPMRGTTYIDGATGLSVYTEAYFENHTKGEAMRSSFRMQIKS